MTSEQWDAWEVRWREKQEAREQACATLPHPQEGDRRVRTGGRRPNGRTYEVWSCSEDGCIVVIRLVLVDGTLNPKFMEGGPLHLTNVWAWHNEHTLPQETIPMHCFTTFLPEGTPPIYDKEAHHPAFVIGEGGQNILRVDKSRRVIVPLWVVDHETFQETDKGSDESLRVLADEVRLSLLRQVAERVKALREVRRSEDTPTETPTIALVVRDVPAVTFTQTTTHLRLYATAKVGLLLSWDLAPEDKAEQLPCEAFLPGDTDTACSLLQPLSGVLIDWQTPTGQLRFAADVERKLREDFFGPALLTP